MEKNTRRVNEVLEFWQSGKVRNMSHRIKMVNSTSSKLDQ